MDGLKRVIVIGCPGSGKSTFARALQAKTGLPLHYLDMMFWNADKTTVSREEFDKRLDAVLATERWLIDGNYSRTLEKRISACDTVYFLDLSTEECLSGVKQRQGKPRPDMPWVENGEDAEFLKFIKDFATYSRPKILSLLEKYSDKRSVVFHSHEEIDKYLSDFDE